MKQELDLLKDIGQSASQADIEPFGSARVRTEPFRKTLRETTDAFIHEGIRRNNMATTVSLACATMMETASTLDRLGLEPDVTHLIDAVVSLVEHARGMLDRGLTVRDAATVNAGAVGLEIIMHGLCHTIGIDYDTILTLIAHGDEAGVRDFFLSKGYGYDIGDAAND